MCVCVLLSSPITDPSPPPSPSPACAPSLSLRADGQRPARTQRDGHRLLPEPLRPAPRRPPAQPLRHPPHAPQPHAHTSAGPREPQLPPLEGATLRPATSPSSTIRPPPLPRPPCLPVCSSPCRGADTEMEERGGGVARGAGGAKGVTDHMDHSLPFGFLTGALVRRPLEEGGRKGRVSRHTSDRSSVFIVLQKKNPPQPFYGPARVERSSFQQRRGRRAMPEWIGYLQG